jgi:transposase-like protein
MRKKPSYVWLFQAFLDARKGKTPMNIITDQDAAMRYAIALVFPNSTHRNCRFHIMDKFSGTIGPLLDQDEELEDDFKECMNHTVTPTEFEEKWAAMLDKYDLQGNERFQHMYALRCTFSPSFFMHSFFPFLQSTQWSEGFNAVLKTYVNPNMSKLHFVEQYQKI